MPTNRTPGSELWISKDGETVFVGRDYARQNEIDENKKQTSERSCFKACQTCGHCANSRRGCAVPKSYDRNAGKMIDCRSCEKFSFHDCNNGFLRDTFQRAEPFTEEHLKLLESTGGKPLID